VKWTYYHLYVILGIYSRYAVGSPVTPWFPLLVTSVVVSHSLPGDTPFKVRVPQTGLALAGRMPGRCQ
jgi:hypothetical protein